MNILILVGIFLLALLAIVVAVLLVMGERETGINAGNDTLLNPAAVPATASGAGTNTRTGAGEPGRSAAAISLPSQGPNAATGMRVPTAMPAAASVPSPVKRTFPSLDSESFPRTEAQEEPDDSNLDGQFHELSAELRTLHTRAQEMEQRISMLMEIVDRLEQDHGDLLDLGIDSEG